MAYGPNHVDYAGDTSNPSYIFQTGRNGGRDGEPMTVFFYNGSGNVLDPPAKMLKAGDDMQVVWTASSGGKTQTLFEYSVQ
jgi:hypothetical protein